MRKKFLLASFLSVIASSWLGNPAHSFTNEINAVESVIESKVGTKVMWSNGHNLCKGDIYGFYNPGKDVVVMCQKNHSFDYSELVGTLKHEGWHAVQRKCNNNIAALSDDLIRKHMDSQTRTVLHKYPHKQHRSEAEARVVEKIPTKNWIKGVEFYCS